MVTLTSRPIVSNLLKCGLRLGTGSILPVLLLTLGLPLPNARAGADNQYGVCLDEIMAAGVAQDQAATACAEALIPKELSACVSQIARTTPIEGKNAVQACFQVRRPIDLANCVADIDSALLRDSSTPSSGSEDSSYQAVLASCRRSLLPGPYSECVIAAGKTGSPLTEAIDTCLSAQDFPANLFPTSREK